MENVWPMALLTAGDRHGRLTLNQRHAHGKASRDLRPSMQREHPYPAARSNVCLHHDYIFLPHSKLARALETAPAFASSGLAPVLPPSRRLFPTALYLAHPWARMAVALEIAPAFPVLPPSMAVACGHALPVSW